MPTTLTEAEIFSAAVVVPNPGELVKAADMAVACQALANRTRALAKTIPGVFFSIDFTLADLTKTINTLADEDVFVICEDVKVGDVIMVDAAWQWKHSGANGTDRALLYRIDDADGTPDEDTIGPGGPGSALSCAALHVISENTTLESAHLVGSYVVTADGNSHVSLRFGCGGGTCTVSRAMLRALVWRPI